MYGKKKGMRDHAKRVNMDQGSWGRGQNPFKRKERKKEGRKELGGFLGCR